MESGPPGARPAVRSRRGRAPGGRVDRRTLHRWSQGRRSATAASSRRAGSPSGRRTGRRRPAHLRQRIGDRLSTASTAATRCCAKKACAATGFWPTWWPTGRPRPAPAAEAGLRVVNVRTGIVQSARGGTLRLMRPLFAAGLGGRLGSGEQWLSWIGLDDLLDVYYRAAVRRSADRARQRRRAGTGAQRRLHQGAGRSAAPSGGGARSVLRSAAAAGAAGRPRTRRGQSAGGADQAARRWATGSGAQRSQTRWLTNWDTADAPHASGSRAPGRGFACRRRR